MRRVANVLLHMGIVVVVLGLSKVHAAFVANPTYDYTSSFRLGWSIAFMVALAGAAYGTGLPDLPRGARSTIGTAVAAATVAVVAFSLLHLLDPTAALPRFVIFGAGILLVPWFAFCSVIAAGGRRRAGRRDTVVVVGDWADATDITAELGRASERPAEVVAVMSAEDARSTGTTRPLQEVAGDASVVVLDRIAQLDDGIVDQVADLHETGVRVRTLSLFYEQWLGKLPVAELERVSLMFDIGAVHRSRYNRLKRVLDLSVCLLALPALALAVPLVAIGNLMANRGPLFYRQQRVGLGGNRSRS